MIRSVLFGSLAMCMSLVQADYRAIVLDTGIALSQSALVVDGRLYAFSVDEAGRHYRIGEVDSDFALQPKTHSVSEQVIFYDAMQTSKGTVAVLLSSTEARRLDDNQLILRFSSLYNAPVVDALPHFDAFRDLNGDGLDDFLMPSFQGYELAIQQPDGTFSKSVSLMVPPIMDMSYNSHPWYQAKSLFLADMNQDALKDVVFWDAGAFVVYPQLATGGFSATAFSVPSSVSLDYDGVDGMSVRMSNQDQSDGTITVVYGIDDYNGDGTADLMTMQVKTAGVFRKTTTFSLHPGQSGKDRHVFFSAEPISGIESNGIQYAMEARDLDGDNDLDLIVLSVELGVGKIIAALLTSSVKIELGIFTMTDGRYPAKADTTREITATFSLSSGEFWRPAVLIQDASGDGLADLLLQDGEKLEIFRGEASSDLFENKALILETPMPRDPDLIEPLQINDDGIVDLLMLIPPPLNEPQGQHRMVLLISDQ